MRNLFREINLIALRNEASGLGDELPLEPPAVGRLVEIQVPTLIIDGDLDQPETLERADVLERSIPDTRKVVMPRGAHLPNMESSGEFNRIVLEFLVGLRV